MRNSLTHLRGFDGVVHTIQGPRATHITGFFSDREIHEHPQADSIVRDMPGFLVACYGARPDGRVELDRRHDRMTYEARFMLDDTNWRLDYDGGGQPIIVRRVVDEKPKHVPVAVAKPAEPVVPTLMKPRRVLQID